MGNLWTALALLLSIFLPLTWQGIEAEASATPEPLDFKTSAFRWSAVHPSQTITGIPWHRLASHRFSSARQKSRGSGLLLASWREVHPVWVFPYSTSCQRVQASFSTNPSQPHTWLGGLLDFSVWVSTSPHDFPIKESGRKSSSCAGRAQPLAGHSPAEQGMPWLAFFGNPSHPQAQQGEIRTVCFIFKFPCFLGHQPDPLFFEYSCLWFNFLWVYFF